MKNTKSHRSVHVSPLVATPGYHTHTHAHIHAHTHTHTLRKPELFIFIIFFFLPGQIIRTFPPVQCLPRAGENVGQGL